MQRTKAYFFKIGVRHGGRRLGGAVFGGGGFSPFTKIEGRWNDDGGLEGTCPRRGMHSRRPTGLPDISGFPASPAAHALASPPAARMAGVRGVACEATSIYYTVQGQQLHLGYAPDEAVRGCAGPSLVLAAEHEEGRVAANPPPTRRRPLDAPRSHLPSRSELGVGAYGQTKGERHSDSGSKRARY